MADEGAASVDMTIVRALLGTRGQEEKRRLIAQLDLEGLDLATAKLRGLLDAIAQARPDVALSGRDLGAFLVDRGVTVPPPD